MAFTIVVPVASAFLYPAGALAPAGATWKSVASRTLGRTGLCHHRGMRRILIVDDDQRFRGIARRLLEAEGFDVVGEAVGGEAALAAARTLRPDLVLLDVHLPDVSGFEIAKRLSADGPSVVLTSTCEASEFGSEISQSGARGFVAKNELSAARIVSLCE